MRYKQGPDETNRNKYKSSLRVEVWDFFLTSIIKSLSLINTTLLNHYFMQSMNYIYFIKCLHIGQSSLNAVESCKSKEWLFQTNNYMYKHVKENRKPTSTWAPPTSLRKSILFMFVLKPWQFNCTGARLLMFPREGNATLLSGFYAGPVCLAIM